MEIDPVPVLVLFPPRLFYDFLIWQQHHVPTRSWIEGCFSSEKLKFLIENWNIEKLCRSGLGDMRRAKHAAVIQLRWARLVFILSKDGFLDGRDKNTSFSVYVDRCGTILVQADLHWLCQRSVQYYIPCNTIGKMIYQWNVLSFKANVLASLTLLIL